VNRVLTADATAGPDAGMDLAWAYDRYGNRWSQTAAGTGGGGATQPSLTFSGDNNRADGYSDDAAGNLLFDGLTHYAYDGANRILSINSQATGYVYDAEGNRVAKLGSGGTVQTVYILTSGNLQLDELTGSGAWNHTNVYAPGGRLLATYDASGQPSPGYHYNLTDWLGTKRMQTTAAGNSQETCTSNPYGDGFSCTGGADATEQHFTGKDHDTESGLDYFYARYYSETLGRFMTPDWAAAPAAVPYAAYGDPQSLNLYAYVNNNPLTGIDADGHCGGPNGTYEAVACATAEDGGVNPFLMAAEADDTGYGLDGTEQPPPPEASKSDSGNSYKSWHRYILHLPGGLIVTVYFTPTGDSSAEGADIFATSNCSECRWAQIVKRTGQYAHGWQVDNGEDSSTPFYYSAGDISTIADTPYLWSSSAGSFSAVTVLERVS
jgi:RHS repeat-associated protein